MNRGILALLVTLSSSVVFAEPVTDQIDSARAAYLRQDLPATATFLESALEGVRAANDRILFVLLPDPPDGWQADEPEGGTENNPFGGGSSTTLTRRYFIPDEAEVTLLIANDPMLLAALGAISMMRQSSPEAADEYTPFAYEGRSGFAGSGDGAWNAHLRTKNRGAVVQLEGVGAKSDETRDLFLGILDWDAIEAQFLPRSADE